ncbi:MAG: VWA domain-containing protein [bacterium]|nr:VWA domain-containing protein [bacterium]
MNSPFPASHAAAPVLSCCPGLPAPVLEAVSLKAVLDDLLAQVEIRQVFANRETGPIEATYTFPVPRGATLLSFTAKLGARDLAGRIMPAPQAEDSYEEAVADGDAAILLQEASPGLYTVSVGNLLPGETAALTYRYAQLQYWQSGTLRFALPTVVAPRYGDPAQAGLQPHQAPQGDLFAHHEAEFRASIRGALLDAEITCPTHEVAVERRPDQAVISFADGATRAMDRDIVLHLRKAAPAAATACSEAAAAGDAHLALLSFCPEAGRPSAPEGRFVKILIDCSGSMTGDSIGQAQDALRRILDSLRPQDRFAISAFGSTCRDVTAASLPGTPEAIAAAREAVRTIRADMGGTALGAALLPLLARRDADGRQGDVLLVTDGELHDDALVAKARAAGGRVFTVGVGCAPGESLLSRLSEQTGGAAEFVTPGDDIAARIHRHFQRLFQPRVASLSVQWPGRVLAERRDREGGLFAGDTVHVLARLQGERAGDIAGEVRVRCELADGTTTTVAARLRPLEGAAGAVPDASLLERLLAAGELRAAVDERGLAGDRPDAALTELAVRCQLLSPWTACLMVALRDDNEKTDGQPALRKVPQMPAAGWGGMGSILHGRMDLAGAADGMRFSMARPDVAPGRHRVLYQGGGLRALERLPRCGVPAGLITAVQALVDEGWDEETACLLLLAALLRAGVALTLGRDGERRVRRQAKSVAAADPDLAARVQALVAGHAGGRT